MALWASVPRVARGFGCSRLRAGAAACLESADRAVEPLRDGPRARARVPDGGGQGDGRAWAARAQGDRRATSAGGASLPHRCPACGARCAGPYLPRAAWCDAVTGGPASVGDPDVRNAAAAVALITEAAAALPRNPNESLLIAVALRPIGGPRRVGGLPQPRLQSRPSMRTRGSEWRTGCRGTVRGNRRFRWRVRPPVSSSASWARSGWPGTVSPSTSVASSPGPWWRGSSSIGVSWCRSTSSPSRCGRKRISGTQPWSCDRRSRGSASGCGPRECPTRS